MFFAIFLICFGKLGLTLLLKGLFTGEKVGISKEEKNSEWEKHIKLNFSFKR